MLATTELTDRRTTADAVFERLHAQIVSLALLPGTKLSEADVARRFGVSRQPVRDAFNRLENLELLMIRPQRATEVRGFSMERIAHARFLRLAVELEVVRRACSVWDEDRARRLERSLAEQQQVIDQGRPEAFHALDFEFHQLICELGGLPSTVGTLRDCKQKVDRLCRLSLGRQREASVLVQDHRRLAHALGTGEVEVATQIVRDHLARLDEVIAEIRRSHPAYFE
ncbi:MAG: GntR family transcriptional regulator [Pseudomonadota bacterium]